MKVQRSPIWPVLTSYDQNHLYRVSLPLGGIGTGTVGLGGRGDLRDWEIMNRPAKGFVPRMPSGNHGPFFAISTYSQGAGRHTRVLEGPIEPYQFEGQNGAGVPNHGLPRFQFCEFHAAYPFGQVLLSDPDVPLGVRLEAFNPLIPGDADRSGLPVAILRFVLVNETREAVEATLCGSIPNFIGFDGTSGASKGNVNEFVQAPGMKGVLLRSDGVPSSAEQYGTIALCFLSDRVPKEAGDLQVSYRLRWAWERRGWGASLIEFWDDLSKDGVLDQPAGESSDTPVASLAAKLVVPAAHEVSLTFLLTWHFPNRQTWTPYQEAPVTLAMECCSGSSCCGEDEIRQMNRVGNYYATRYRDAWDVAQSVARELDALEERTLTFVSSFVASDLPDVVKEAALYNLTALRSQTSFRTQDGYFFGFEGCNDHVGCCYGSCTHVWNYEQATAFLFGDLSRAMREVEFLHATDDRGLMSFRVNLPLSRAQEFGKAAADGQMGCIMKLYRDWQLSGDDEFLRKLWPKARKTLEFCWIPGGWDADRDGVMEGCQHNTLDVEYFGPNPLMAGWYLGALRAAEEMAWYLGEHDFAKTCRQLFEKGRKWVDAHLFNGEYYEQQIRPPTSHESIAEGLGGVLGGNRGQDFSGNEPLYQVGAGCLVDQLVGQYMAHVCGLGYLLDPNHVKTTLESIMKYNYRAGFYGHFNAMRSYALNDEEGLLMCSFPRGRRPSFPTPYYNEVMTGFEYTAAVHMIYEGLEELGLRVMRSIRARYDGLRRNPFDEAECGHHYARAMASWAAVLAITGFHWSGVEKRMSLRMPDSSAGTFFWSNGSAWGTYSLSLNEAKDEVDFRLAVAHGVLTLRRVVLEKFGEARWESDLRLGEGESITVTISRSH